MRGAASTIPWPDERTMLFGSSTLPSGSTRVAWMESVGPSSFHQTTTWYPPPKTLSEGATLPAEI